MKKIILLLTISLLSFAPMQIKASQNGYWYNDFNNWYFLDETNQPITGWIQDEFNCWYYLDYETGIMHTGWAASNEDWYYFGEGGVMQESKWIDDTYYLQGNGKMAKGIVQINNEFHEFAENGTYIGLSQVQNLPEDPQGEENANKDIPLKNGWISNRYYVDGEKANGWYLIDGTDYYFKQGKPADGYIRIDGQRYYFKQGILQDKKTEKYSEMEQELADLINEERILADLNPVAFNHSRLNQAAKIRAEELAILLDHYRPDESYFDTVLAEVGLEKINWYSENIASGYSSAEEALQFWMNSPAHKEAILNPDFTTFAISITKNDWIGYDFELLMIEE